MNGLTNVVTAVKKEAVPTMVKAGISTAAVLAGSAGVALVPDVTVLEKVPVVGTYLSKSAPGLALIIASGVVAFKVKDEKAQLAAIGGAIAGTIDILRRNGVLAMINSKIQTGLNGLRGMRGIAAAPAGVQAGMRLQAPTIDIPHRVVSSSQLLQ